MAAFEGEWGGIWSYDKRRRLGREGGFGAVYEGRAENGDQVAVKVIRGPGAGGHQPLELRHRELDIAKKLRFVSSQHLIPILDVGVMQGNLMLVMPSAEGNLEDLMRGPQPADAAISVLTEVSLGLRDLHAQRIVHRDLKPANILRLDGTWRLADFGMGRDLERGRGKETFAMGGGTVHYEAPEVWRYESPTDQTDLYSLGCIAYELYTGKPPFAQLTDVETIRHHHLNHRPKPLRCTNTEFSQLVADLLRKRRKHRPRNAEEVLQRLDSMMGPASLF